MSSPPFPSTVPSHDIPFPPQGLLGVGFPCFNGTMECSDSRSFVPTRFVSFACRYHPRSCTSLPPMTRATSKGRGLLLFASLSPRRLFSDGNDRASQVPGEPLWACPVLKTPAGPSRQALAARRCGLPPLEQRRLPQFASFEARWHGPPTRCLRFAGRITPPPRKTRFRLSATLCRTGCCLLQGPYERFQPCLTTSHPPFPSFLDAIETKPFDMAAGQ